MKYPYVITIDHTTLELTVDTTDDVFVYGYIVVVSDRFTFTSFPYKIQIASGCTKGFCSRAFLGYTGMTLKFWVL